MEHTLTVNNEQVTLNHRQFMQAVRDAIRSDCQCGVCLNCVALVQERRNIQEELLAERRKRYGKPD